jgi:hypothetical protein
MPLSLLLARRAKRESLWPRTIAVAAGMTLVALLGLISLGGFEPAKDIERLLQILLSQIIIQRYYYTRSFPGAKSFGFYIFLTLVLSGLISAVTRAALYLFHIQ